jgi:hypothetical protein
MRIERRKLGTRVRVILNRTEAVTAALAAIAAKTKRDVGHPSPRSTTVYIGGIGRGEGDYHADPGEFEKQCRIIAERQIVIPVEASFRVGLDEEGGVVGATFQFYNLTDSN